MRRCGDSIAPLPAAQLQIAERTGVGRGIVMKTREQKARRWSIAKPVLTFGLLALVTQSGACTIMVTAQLPPGADGGPGGPGTGGDGGPGGPGTGGDGGVDPGNPNPDPN